MLPQANLDQAKGLGNNMFVAMVMRVFACLMRGRWLRRVIVFAVRIVCLFKKLSPAGIILSQWINDFSIKDFTEFDAISIYYPMIELSSRVEAWANDFIRLHLKMWIHNNRKNCLC